MIKGIGTDIIEIQRIKDAVKKNERFLRRVFTPGEISYCESKSNPYPSLAARFAAKEGASKALGTGIGQISWTEIEVTINQAGKPNIILHGKALELAEDLGIKDIHVTLSHSKEYGVAMVIMEGD